MSHKLVSIIMPSYNNGAFIAEAIKSVLAQTYPYWELLIVDDASNDGSLERAESFQGQDARIKVFVMGENQGADFCRNYATKKSSGDYIAFLDADDLWTPDKLERQLTFMKEHDLGVSFTSYKQIDLQGKDKGIEVQALPELSAAKQKTNNFIGNLTGIYAVDKVGRIMGPEMRKRQDWALWHKAIQLSGKPAKGMAQVLAAYRVSPDSMSARKWGLIRHNFAFYHQYLGYSWAKSSLWLMVFFATYFFVRPRYIKKTAQ